MILLHIHLIQYLGHSVSNEGIKILDSHMNKILDWKLQTTAKGLQSSLGFNTLKPKRWSYVQCKKV